DSRSSLSRRGFSMAVRSFGAKFLKSSIFFSVDWRNSWRKMLMITINALFFCNGTPGTVRGPRSSAPATVGGTRAAQALGLALGISLGRGEVGKMGRLLRSHHLTQSAARGRTEWAAAARLGKCRRHIVRSDNSQSVSLAEIERAEFGFAKPGRVREHALKYRLELGRRARNDTQN